MKPLLAGYARPISETSGETIDRGTYETPIHQSLLMDRDVACAKSTLITRVKNETTDDN